MRCCTCGGTGEGPPDPHMGYADCPHCEHGTCECAEPDVWVAEDPRPIRGLASLVTEHRLSAALCDPKGSLGRSVLRRVLPMPQVMGTGWWWAAMAGKPVPHLRSEGAALVAKAEAEGWSDVLFARMICPAKELT